MVNNHDKFRVKVCETEKKNCKLYASLKGGEEFKCIVILHKY